jgi:mono/diheme cytochrome c family protein
MMSGRWQFIIPFPLVLFAIAAVAIDGAVAADGSAEKGKVAYVKHGCWQCHGFAAQGGIAGPKLAPDPMPLVALTAFVRNTRGAMPPYQEPILSNADLADIHAWLLSLPKAPDYRSIPLLNP